MALVRAYVCACACSGALQLTGYNAVFAYAFSLFSALGSTPTTTNAAVYLWTFIVAVTSVMLLPRMRPGRVYVVAAGVIVVADAVLALTFVFVTAPWARFVLTIGLAVMMGAFNARAPHPHLDLNHSLTRTTVLTPQS